MAGLLNCSAIHCTENVLLVWKCVWMWIPPLQPILCLSHSLPPPSNRLSVSLSKSFELNVLFSQNIVTSAKETSKKGKIWPFGRPYPDPGLFSHLWIREEAEAEVRGKEIDGLVVFLLRTLKVWSIFALNFKIPECFLPDSMQLQAPSHPPFSVLWAWT